ncbi:unnamed protein product [Allacma fusca]|uniref:Uncharacterized protein n=1 Tax=Allacma fusca TaxID=39272 RepID=A0A8J2NYN1_9HEXA|nr:unnamed protein product [Allacma fusca]
MNKNKPEAQSRHNDKQPNVEAISIIEDFNVGPELSMSKEFRVKKGSIVVQISNSNRAWNLMFGTTAESFS